MKTTIELPDGLLADVKALAANRRTTLKALIEKSLRRELLDEMRPTAGEESIEENDHGFPILKRSEDRVVTSEKVYEMMEELGV